MTKAVALGSCFMRSATSSGMALAMLVRRAEPDSKWISSVRMSTGRRFDAREEERREGQADQAGEAAVIELGEAALVVVVEELGHVPAGAGAERPAARAEPLAQTGDEEDR